MPRLSQTEFIALLAMMFATVAVSIDAMLPALPDIGAELSPDDPNRAQLIVSSFVLGLGVGTFVTGPLSDSFGRKPVILGGFALFFIGAALAWLSASLELILAARMLQGLGAAAPRIVALAVVRDLYTGRDMARLVSVATMIFSLFPAVGPLIGSWIIALSNWRGIFLLFVFFVLVLFTWTSTRLTESLSPEDRRPFRVSSLLDATRQMMAEPVARIAMLVQGLCMGALFSILILVQPIFDITFDKAQSFPLWFALVALISATGSAVNAVLVVRIGMQRMVIGTLAIQMFIASVMVVAEMVLPVGAALFAIFMVFQASLFFMAGTTLGNLQALAMGPLGHIAGLVASVLGGVSTIFGALIGIPVGQAFDGHIWPLSVAVGVMCLGGVLLMLLMRRVAPEILTQA